MVYRVLARKHHSGVFQNIDFRLAELCRSNAFNLEKLVEIDVDAILAFQLCIRRFFKIRGSILGDKDVFYLHFPPIFVVE